MSPLSWSITRSISPQAIYRSASFYPITGLYLGGVATGLAISQGAFNVGTGIIIFGVLAALALIMATLRELKAVHRLVDGQRAELVSRIDELSALMVDGNIVVPPQGLKERAAREGVRIEQERE